MVALIQPSMAGGVLAPSLYGRVDITKYAVGLRTGLNIFVHPHGGASNRAGTEFIGPVRTHVQIPRLVPFKFKTTDAYILEFGDQYMRVIRNGGHVLESAVAISGATQANPVVITANGHGYSNGDEVFISGIAGMTEPNGKRFIVANVTTNTFELTDQITGSNVDGTGFAAYSSGGTAARVYTLATPYVIADVRRLKFTQSADVMTITRLGYSPRELRRSDHDDWSLSEIEFNPQQAFPTTVTASNNAGAGTTYYYKVTAISADDEESLSGTDALGRVISDITQANPAVVTSTAHLLENGDEIEITGVVGMTELNGRRFRIASVTANTFELQNFNGESIDSTSYTAYSSGGTVDRGFDAVNSGDTPDVTITWDAVSGASRYSVYRRSNGIYGLIGESETNSFVDNNIAPDTEISPPRYAEPFLESGEYPQAVGYFEQRRVFGGSSDKPDTYDFSKTGHQNNFTRSSPTLPDDAIRATLNSREVNEIRHFVALNDLIVLTEGAEWLVNSGGEARFSPDTIKQKPQTYWGASHIPPIVIGGEVIFVQELGSYIRNLGYSFAEDKYDGDDLTLLSNHFFRGYEIVDWAYAQVPDSLVHVVRDDGSALCLTYNKSQQVVAWTNWETLGKYESVATIPDFTVNENSVYFVVQRTINGQTVRYIERQHTRQFTDVEDCFFVDCGLSFDNPIAITGATAANPVVITAASHGFSNGDLIDISGLVAGQDSAGNATNMTELNGNRYKAANVTTNTFELTDPSDDSNIDGSAFKAYVEGGFVRKAVTTISGADHLEGETIVILADGNVVEGTVVSNGSFTLANPASRIHFGLGYVSDVETLNIEAPQGTIQGRLKKISKVVMRFERSRGLFIGPTFNDLVEMKQREFELMGAPTSLLTGDKEIHPKPQWDVNGRVCVRQRYPLPMTILAFIPDLSVGG